MDLGGVRPAVLAAGEGVLPALTTPTLIVWGDRDRIIPVEHAYAVGRECPSVQLHVFPGCGHNPQLERTDALVDLLEAFATAPGPAS
jgi:pimeloyl-ACP methyl ester carboxylesterase